MQNKVRLFFLFLLEIFLYQACCLRVFSQDKPTDFIVTLRYLTSEEGLAGKLVNCGMQDSKGFTWFGTQHGLQRYDGKNFKLFTKEKDGLQDNNVVQLAEDENHLLWIMYGVSGTNRYLTGKADVLDLNTYRVESVTGRFGSSLPFSESRMLIVEANAKNELLILTDSSRKTQQIWHYDSNTFKKITDGYTVYGLRRMTIFNNDRLMLEFPGANTGLLTLDGKLTLAIKGSSEKDVVPLGINDKNESFVAEIDRHQSFPGTKYSQPVIHQLLPDGTMRKLTKQIFQVSPPTVLPSVYLTFNECRSGNIILSEDRTGLFLFNGRDFLRLMDTLQMKANHFPRIYDYFKTGNNQHWLCTDRGVIIITVRPNYFRHILSNDVIKFGLVSDYQTRSIYQDSNNVYAVCWKGLYKISKTDSGSYAYKKLLSDEIVGTGNGFYCDGKNFWTTGPHGEVTRLNIISEKIDYFPAESNEIWCGITTREGQLLLGGTEYVSAFENDRFKKIKFCNGGNKDVAWFYHFLYSRDGRLWAVSNRGLFEIENNCIKGQYMASAKDMVYRIPFTDLNYVHEDKEGAFWLATNGGGLIKWNRKENTFQQFTVADGLSSNVLYSILEDGQGFFWISSEYGLMRFDPVSHFIKTYTTDDGITDNEFNRISFFKARDGKMFFGGMNGINAFYPGDFMSDTAKFTMPLRVVSFNQFNGSDDKLIEKTNELIQNNSITLSPGDKFFTLEFQLLDFEEGRHRYAYRIEGIDKDWNYLNENSIRLSGLPYGKYTLRVRGQNFEGAWSKNELSFPLSVLRPFYMEGWFYFIAVFFLIALVYGVMHWRTRSLEKANARLEEVVGRRTLQLQDSLNQKDFLLKEIHHRVKNNLQVISSLLELQTTNVESDAVKKVLVEGQARVRSIALIHHRLYEQDRLGEVEFGGFIKDLYKQVAAVFQKEGHEVEVFYDLPETWFDIDTIVPLGLVSNELFTNSFKYAFNSGTKGKISVTLATGEKGNYIVTYADSGPGLPAGFDLQKATSLGLRLIRRLGKQLGGQVSYDKDQNIFRINLKNSVTRKQND